MTTASQIAKHLREVFFGGNWTEVNLKDTLIGIDWNQATKKVQSFNTIALLTFHIGYYLTIQLKVLKGQGLEGHDRDSFNLPAISSETDWEKLKDRVFGEAEELATYIERLPDEKMWDTFINDKYGIYYRNFAGMIEHTYYHLGQITLLKKMVSTS